MKITITPEEKFNQEVWWILQEIRKEQLSTPKGEKVEFSIRLLSKRSRKTDNSLPSAEAQRKLLYKLKEWQTLDLEPTGLYFDDLFTPPTAYRLIIHQSKFDKLYRLYEGGSSYSENKNATPETKNLQSIIKTKSLELIAREIGDLETGTNLINFLIDCGVDEKLIEYPQTKWRMVYTVLTTLATSNELKDREVLFKVIEEASHPLMHGGDEELAKQTEERLNKYLKYDGFQLHDFKIKKITDNATGSKPLKTGNVKKECIEELAYELYKEAKKINKVSGEHSCEVILEKVVEYPSSSGKDFTDKTYQNTEIILKHFKKEKIIKDYLIKQCGTIVAETIGGEEYTTDGAEIQCKFNLQKAIAYLRNLYEPKKLFAEKLAKLYLKLINIIELYFQKPITRDEKLNRFYLKISDELNQLLNKNIIPELGAYYKPSGISFTSEGEATEEILPYKNIISELKTPYYKPFSSLFSAQKEIQENKTNLQIVINSLNAFYGEIHKFVSLYDIEKKEIEEIEELDKYINDLKIQKEKQKKEPAPSKIEVVGLQDGLKAIAQTKKEDKNRFPYKLPAGTKWEDITFQFLDDENAFIKVRQHKHYTNYKEMKLVGRGKNPKPSELWAFLKVLATKNGEIAIKDPEVKTKYKKQKELLSKFLRSYFRIDLDPFYPYEVYPPYKHQKSYKIRMMLISPPQSEKEQEDFNDGKDDLEIKKHYKEQTPEIYDKYQ